MQHSFTRLAGWLPLLSGLLLSTPNAQAQTDLHCAGAAPAETKHAAGTRQRPTPTGPTSCQPYYIKVNIHYMLHPDPDSVNNFAENTDGGSAAAWKWDRAGNHLQANRVQWAPLPAVAPRADYNGYAFARDVINEVNAQNATNEPMQLPVGNTTPVVAKNIAYVLNGVYFHRSPTMWQYDPKNHYDYPAGVLSPAQFDTYGVNKASEINIFLMGQNTCEQDPNERRWIYWSGGAATIGYSSNNNWMKIGNVWRNHLINRVNDPNSDDNGSVSLLAHTINHEIGHLLGLGHPAQWQQCPDTPPLGPNYSIGDGNNLMDYSMGNALTPCQIDIMHQYMGSSYSAYTSCNLGCPPINSFFTLPACVSLGNMNRLSPALIMDGRGSWVTGNSKSYWINITEVDNNGVQIAGTPSPTYIYRGQPDKMDLGGFYSWQLNKRYAVKLTVATDCSNHVSTQYVQVSNIGCMSSMPASERRSASAAAPAQVATKVDLFPNPTTTGEFTVLTSGSTPAHIAVYDSYGKAVVVQAIKETVSAESATSVATYRLATKRPGVYVVEVFTSAGQRVLHHLSVAP